MLKLVLGLELRSHTRFCGHCLTTVANERQREVDAYKATIQASTVNPSILTKAFANRVLEGGVFSGYIQSEVTAC